MSTAPWRLAPELEVETSPNFIPIVAIPADQHAYRTDLVAYGMGETVPKAKEHARLIIAAVNRSLSTGPCPHSP